MELCRICPRKCNIDRSQSTGFCREGDLMRVSRIAPHYYEEPPISYKNGSGTVFFRAAISIAFFVKTRT